MFRAVKYLHNKNHYCALRIPILDFGHWWSVVFSWFQRLQYGKMMEFFALSGRSIFLFFSSCIKLRLMVIINQKYNLIRFRQSFNRHPSNVVTGYTVTNNVMIIFVVQSTFVTSCWVATLKIWHSKILFQGLTPQLTEMMSYMSTKVKLHANGDLNWSKTGWWANQYPELYPLSLQSAWGYRKMYISLANEP